MPRIAENQTYGFTKPADCAAFVRCREAYPGQAELERVDSCFLEVQERTDECSTSCPADATDCAEEHNDGIAACLQLSNAATLRACLAD